MPSFQHLSKSRVLAALQCPKSLYLKVNNPELEQLDQHRLDTGHQVGDIARDTLGEADGVLVGHDQELHKAVAQTTKLVTSGDRPIYEATFIHDGVLVRVDLLLPSGDGWKLIEVKSSGKKSFLKSKTSSKRKNLIADCAIQSWVLNGCGIQLKSISLALIDNDWVYSGNDDYDGLLSRVDVTEEVRDVIDQVPDWLVLARTALTNGEPKAKVGTRCNNPYTCGFWDQCWPVDEEYPVTALGGPGLVASLVNAGICDVRKVPREWLDSISGIKAREKAKRVWNCTRSGKPQFNSIIKHWVSDLEYPRYFLDFETVSPAVPLWPGYRPYETIPFQYSIHVETPERQLDHKEFLDLSGNDPSRQLAEQMIRDLGKDGPVLSYSSYELRVINWLIKRYPDLTVPLSKILERLIDMLPPIRESVIHPEFHGSWSIKDVAPVLAPTISYENGYVSNGSEAGAFYMEAVALGVDAGRKEKIRLGLLQYCKLDTECMYEVAVAISGS